MKTADNRQPRSGGGTTEMKPAKIFPAILCILALLACCFSATAEGVSARSVKPGEKVNGVIETATEAVFRVTFPSEGTAQLKSGGKALRAVVQKEAGRERIISGTADDSGRNESAVLA